LEGGADTGFKRVLPEAYQPRLFRVKKGANRKITCEQVPLKRGNLSSEDVFIIDNGLKIYQVKTISTLFILQTKCGVILYNIYLIVVLVSVITKISI